jgi:hypothetical protein
MVRAPPWSFVKMRENQFKKCGGLWRVVEGDNMWNPIPKCVFRIGTLNFLLL